MYNEFTEEQMNCAKEIEQIVLDNGMHVREKCEYLQKCWFNGYLDELYRDFEEFIEAVSAAEYEMLYN